MFRIPFYKMSGSGNDFIVIDNRADVLNGHDPATVVRGVCVRGVSLGADGMVLVENTDQADFKWRFFNPDGSSGEMCGNAARCVARFAYLQGIAKEEMRFETLAGIIHASVNGERVRVRMPEPSGLSNTERLPVNGVELDCRTINTGVPHVVIPVRDVASTDVVRLGRAVRYHERFAPAGVNVNFFTPLTDGRVACRTYERGVENETLACGTGCTAVALSLAETRNLPSPVTLVPASGIPLAVSFRKSDGRYADVHLEGDARIVCSGELWEDAWS